MTSNVADFEDRVGQSLQGSERADFGNLSDAAGCLMPLLAALNWHGEKRAIAEAAPHFAEGMDIGDLRKILAELKFSTHQRRLHLRDIDPRLLPCVFAIKDSPLLVILSADESGYEALDGETGRTFRISDDPIGDAYLIFDIDKDTDVANPQLTWSAGLLARFRPYFLQVLLITALTSVLALSVPLFIKSLYDHVIPAKSNSTLMFLAIGMVVVVISEGALRLIRARLIGFVGARTDLIVGTSTFRQLLKIPLTLTERTPIGAQIAGLQRFEALRESFIGPLASVFFELPFVLLAITLIALLAGPVAWIPAGLTVVFIVIGLVVYPMLRRLNRVLGTATARRSEFLMETIDNLRAIKEAGANDIWADRHRSLSAAAAEANFRVTRANAIVQTISQQLMFVAGIAILALGAQRVMQQHMSMGSLIAVMAIAWRVLGPLQAALVSLAKFNQVESSLKQLDRLMALPREKEAEQGYHRTRRFAGHVNFDRISMRYVADGNPALLGVSFNVEPGEVLAITGASGSGKSTIIRLIMGLYTPQAGSVSLDGIDIRQLDVRELRSAVTYMPQQVQIFHGTIAQNMRLTNPVATEGELIDAAMRANMWKDIDTLPDGLETRLTDAAQSQFSGGFLSKLSLAQAYLKPAVIYLLDEPSSNIDHNDDRVLMQSIEALRGRSTVIMTTQRPSHLKMADKILVLRNGGVGFFGTPSELVEMGGL